MVLRYLFTACLLVAYILLSVPELIKKRRLANYIKKKVAQGESLTIHLTGSFPSEYCDRSDSFTIGTTDQGITWFFVEGNRQISACKHPRLYEEIWKINQCNGPLKPGLSVEEIQYWIINVQDDGYEVEVIY